ncbi:Gag-Pol polyprotein [Vitis vinifera]|uniref:RNA-directed DNA polymerase n=1 Tax=Vitis vinifera TaxID=29760 RepID=A0A438C776_VITVI|nr:Gag-Pol polyprotein [Vitis vinifera]
MEEIKGKKKDISEGKEDHDSTVNANGESTYQGDVMKKHTPPPFPQALHGKKGIRNASEILEEVVEKALLDLGASVNLLPYSVYKQLGLGELKPTSITLSLADRSVKIPRIIEDVLVQVDNFYYPVDFVEWTYATTFGNMTLELNIFYMSKSQSLREEEKVQKRFAYYLQGWRRIEEILPLFNKEEAQEAAKERPKAQSEALPTELKYTYLEENKNSPWVSPTQVVPKKSGITMVQNEKEKKLLHASLSVGKSLKPSFLLFLGCLLRVFSKIEIDVEDQEKTTFTCPFGTYAAEECLLVYAMHLQHSNNECLVNLEAVLNRCIEKDLVLNWEKCHFMVQQGIVLGHIISKKGVEVDKAKVEIIIRLPPPTTVKGLRQFLGHVGAVLGQRENGKPYVIYYVSKNIERNANELHSHKNELLAVVFALDKFHACLMDSLYYKSFNLPNQDKKGVENVVAATFQENAPWYAHIANYLVTGEVPNYVSKWVEAIPCKHNDHRVVLKFLKENIFSRFGVPKAIISDGGTRFLQQAFETLLDKYGVKHKVATTYHPQTSGQVELANREIKNILMKSMAKHAISLWKLNIRLGGAIKKVNMDLTRAGIKRCLDLNEMEELRNDAYINSKLQNRG